MIPHFLPLPRWGERKGEEGLAWNLMLVIWDFIACLEASDREHPAVLLQRG
jgi:hypothetical protein